MSKDLDFFASNKKKKQRCLPVKSRCVFQKSRLFGCFDEPTFQQNPMVDFFPPNSHVS
jgi:hypothetical protein